jgi:hypothetical protein
VARAKQIPPARTKQTKPEPTAEPAIAAPEPASQPASLAPPASPEVPPLLAGFLTQPQLLAELNKVFKVDKRTFQRWEAQKCGPPKVMLGGGRKILYARDSVLAWLRTNERKVLRSR